MKDGVDRLLADGALRRRLRGRRVALLANPASMTGTFEHSLEALARCREINLTAAFGPQHGIRGDRQDNMVETSDEVDPRLGIPVFSLYGAVRRPTDAMLDQFDVLLVDLQDVGCRVYTFLTTLCYLVEDCARSGKGLWVLDRPNPAGRPAEGLRLVRGNESFVGIGPLPMRHGLTLGEAARWHAAEIGAEMELAVVTMTGYQPDAAPGYGWPAGDMAWINPSPNLATLNAARCYAGTVMIEGTTLSEGRGTTRPLEVVGAPGIDTHELLARMRRLAPAWLNGCRVRPCHFEPVFHKHAGQTCAGIHIHTDHPDYRHYGFRPYRLIALLLKALRQIEPDYPLWRDFEYEYVSDRLAIDVICGGDELRSWVDDDHAQPGDLASRLAGDEASWREERAAHLMY